MTSHEFHSKCDDGDGDGDLYKCHECSKAENEMASSGRWMMVFELWRKRNESGSNGKNSEEAYQTEMQFMCKYHSSSQPFLASTISAFLALFSSFSSFHPFLWTKLWNKAWQCSFMSCFMLARSFSFQNIFTTEENKTEKYFSFFKMTSNTIIIGYERRATMKQQPNHLCTVLSKNVYISFRMWFRCHVKLVISSRSLWDTYSRALQRENVREILMNFAPISLG